MATTIHLPPTLLESVDRQAKERGLSRNRYIRCLLEKGVEEETEWSPGLRRMLAATWKDEECRQAVDDMLADIKAHRTTKPPPDL